MLEDLDPADRHDLRAGYDHHTDAYDRTRTVLPDAVFDDLFDLASLSRGDRVLEIGCGTGQATLPLATRGLAITAVELGPALADRARARLQPFRSVEVVTSAFEDWRESAPLFCAVVAVNSLHWIDPDQRYAKPARLLVPGGAMAVAACHWARPADADPFFFDVQEDYQAVGWEGHPPPEPDAIRLWHFPPDALVHFEELGACRYPFRVRHSVEDFLAHLDTQCGTRQLGDQRSQEFLTRVRARLVSLGRSEVTRTLVAQLTIGRRRD